METDRQVPVPSSKNAAEPVMPRQCHLSPQTAQGRQR